ncbi:MAG: polysaccharide biosynthesis protein [Candidatus Electrothrix sp. GM3_4]|nr:polysaccharide biosynthesis protein [Candidatus Electrothrix sp. GM3_4]
MQGYRFLLKQKIQWHFVLLRNLVTNRSFWLVASADIFLITLAFYLAGCIRFGDVLTEHSFIGPSPLLLLAICIKMPVFYIAGLYRGMWRYLSHIGLWNILKGVFVSEVFIVIFLLYTGGENQFAGYSRSFFFVDGFLAFSFIGGQRITIWYLYKEFGAILKSKPDPLLKKRLLLVGAGDSAEKILRETLENKSLSYLPVGLVDDNPKKIGLEIHNVRVVGMSKNIKEIAEYLSVEEILISIAHITGLEMQRIVGLCQETGIPFKVLPRMAEIIDGRVSVKTMRDISYADLLGRKEILLEQDRIGQYVKDEVVLITGAGGTIGSELCRQLLTFSPKQIIIFDASEENLYSLQMELLHKLKWSKCVPILGNLQTQRVLTRLFEEYRPSVVFHAAAYKHVPLIENHPWEAVYNNVIASQRLMETSIRYNVKRFVLVSTDKAVRPTNVMGASKRLIELMMLAYNSTESSEDESNPNEEENETVFMAVRFGNVLGSSGSVIPLFKNQIEHGGPVTITHPEITRYFMSVQEAAQLILQAGAMGSGGEIFILKMGAPIKIAEMARTLIDLAGYVPDEEIEIQYTGLREGEKLYEELITDGEGIVETGHNSIMVLRGDGYADYYDLFRGIEKVQRQAEAYDSNGIKAAMKRIIPEYTPEYV